MKTPLFFYEIPIPKVSRCPSPTLGISDGICISSDLSDTEVSPAPNGREGHDTGGHSILAKETAVHAPSHAGSVQAFTPSMRVQPPISR